MEKCSKLISSMQPRERIAAAFLHQPTDKAPVFHVGFSSKAAGYILGREAFVGGGIQQWREIKSLYEGWHEEFIERSYRDAIELTMATGQDMIRTGYWRHPQAASRKVDEYTYAFDDPDPRKNRVFHFDPESEQAHTVLVEAGELTLDDIRADVATAEQKLETFQPDICDWTNALNAFKTHGQTHAIQISCGSIGIPISQASIWLEAMLLDPGLVKAYVAVQVETAWRTLDFLAPYGVRFVFGGGDFASETGPIYSPALFRDLILPGIAAIHRHCRQLGMTYSFASDGNLWPVADFLFGTDAVDGYYEIDRKAGMDLQALRERFPRLTLLGNISSWTLSRGSPEDVAREVRSCLKIAGQLGGVIVGISNYIQPETPPANINALLKTLKTER